MYRFQVSAPTQMGESIGLVGSVPELGLWNVEKCLRLQTGPERYPLWWVDVELDPVEGKEIEYKYVRLSPDGSPEWESIANRWLPLESESSLFVVEGGHWNYAQPWPFGYVLGAEQPPYPQAEGAKIVVIGSSVAHGFSAWRFQGWAWHLSQKLSAISAHQFVNASMLGANVHTTIERFPVVVAPERPDIVIIALSLGNEGLAYCPAQQRRGVQRRFESGLRQLIKMTQELGSVPILAGLYPHEHYSPEHYKILQDTHRRIRNWGVPILDWLSVVDDGQGRWRPGLAFDPAHPNSEGHRLMVEAIDLDLFKPNLIKTNNFSIGPDPLQRQLPPQDCEVPIYRDECGFHVLTYPQEERLRIINTSSYTYTITPTWQEFQNAIQTHAKLPAGLYISADFECEETAPTGIPPALSISEDGTIDGEVVIPAFSDLKYGSTSPFFSPQHSQILFYDGQLGILKRRSDSLYIINESDHEYNIHPMWKEVRDALREMDAGVYQDPRLPDAPFRTLMIGKKGLESRVKAPAKSVAEFRFKCLLTDISRVAIIPLGDRCAVRMMLYKIEYDGPAFPFDLTRTTNLDDVADMIEKGFQDMWSPTWLRYDHDQRRIFHTRWTGLSFAHEVEETEDPLISLLPIYERMRTRYSARSERFWYTLAHSDKVLFVRTGLASRGSVINLVHKLEKRCQGKPFHLLLLSPQPSQEFADLPNVQHHNVEFNPDRMHEDPEHWMYCARQMQRILDALGISSKNLFWCPPNPKN